jgi:hypothetical protein
MHGTGFLAIWSDLAPEDETDWAQASLPSTRPSVTRRRAIISHAGRAARMDFAIRTGGAAFVVRGFAGTPTRGLRILVRTQRSD